MHTAWLIPVLPLLGFLFNLLLGKRLGKGAVTAVGVGTIALSFVLACVLFAAMLAAPGHRLDLAYGEWMDTGAFSVPLGFVIDPLSGIMMLVITGIGFLIHLYTAGYMAEATTALLPLLRLHEPLRVLHAHLVLGATSSDVPGLGGRGPLLLPAHRLLLRQGISPPPPPRRPSSSTAWATWASWWASSCSSWPSAASTSAP